MKKEKSGLKKDNEVSAIDFERVSEILHLKDKIQRLEFDVDAWHQLKLLLEGEIEKLGEENKKLKSDLAYERTMLDNVRAEYESSQNVIKELKEKIETLELWLDNKEKLNEEYRKQIDKLRTDNVYEEGLYD